MALARALAVEPRVLLLDEPFGALDAQVRKDLRRWLREIHDATGHTTIFVTHDQDEALELADRVAILNDGRIEQVGTPDEVYDHPASPFVADFLGLAVSLAARAEGGRVLAGDRPLPGLSAESLSGPVELLCRPSDLALVEPDSGAFAGIVRAVRRVGARRHLEIDLDGGGLVSVEVPADRAVARGERVGLAVARAQVVAGRRAGG